MRFFALHDGPVRKAHPGPAQTSSRLQRPFRLQPSALWAVMNVSDPLWFQCWALGDEVEYHLEFSLLKPRIPSALSWDDVFLGLVLLGKAHSVYVSSGRWDERMNILTVFFCCRCACLCLSAYVYLQIHLSRKAFVSWHSPGKQKAAKSWCIHRMKSLRLSAIVVPWGCCAPRMNLICSETQHHFWFKNQYLKTISSPVPSGCGMSLQIRPL